MTEEEASHPNLEFQLFETNIGEENPQLAFKGEVVVPAGSVAAVFEFEGEAAHKFDAGEVKFKAMLETPIARSAELLAGAGRVFRQGQDITFAAVGAKWQADDRLRGETFIELSDRGHLTGIVEMVGSLSLTDKLVLEPRMEVLWAADDIPEDGIGAGITEVGTALRLRRRLSGAFDVYVGVRHERLVGATRSVAMSLGEDQSETQGVVGLGWAF